MQKQTWAEQRTRFKASVTVGDYTGHVALGVKCFKQVATAICSYAKAAFDALSKTSGKRLCSPGLLIRNSLTILSKPTLECPFRGPNLQLWLTHRVFIPVK